MSPRMNHILRSESSHRVNRSQPLWLERLEDRAVPSAAPALDLASGLDGAALLGVPEFAGSAQPNRAKDALYDAGGSPVAGASAPGAGQSATPVVDASSATPADSAPLGAAFAAAARAIHQTHAGPIAVQAGPAPARQPAAPAPGPSNWGNGLPVTGLFFTDGNNQLWLYFNGQFINTGGFCTKFSAGIDANNQPECFFFDGNNQLWRYDNGVFTDLLAFGTDLAAARGTVDFIDGDGVLWNYSDPNAPFLSTVGGSAGAFTDSGHFANGVAGSVVTFVSNFGGVFYGPSYFFYLDSDNNIAGQLFWVDPFGSESRLLSGGASQWSVGDAISDIYFTAEGQIWTYGNGPGWQPINMGAYAAELAATGTGSAFFTDGNNKIWWATMNNGQPFFLDTGAFANHISGSSLTDALFFTDGNNQIYQYQSGTFTNTGAFAVHFSAF